MKKVLVIGGGGREHAIVDAISRSPQVGKIFCAPGNAGIAQQAECVAIKDTDVEGLKNFALENGIDLAVVGPEVALAAGVVDAFKAAGLRIFGPSKAAATIEASKDFAKQLMAKYNIPTAAFETFEDYDAALEYVKKGSFPVVLKYDGLAAGKGVVIPETLARLPWRPSRGSLTSSSYLVRNRTLGPPLENNPEIPPSSRDEGLRLLHF